ncbi:hypothetical protein Acr_00g0089880 [Actinidia rufa]|uniref:Hemerythrin-like domain-containing protein n=1 Tax=Actinidia rufa TaxID=165716 RepID=A0A7J0DWR5_9ERIC|nr:hypothetical protein Acr_00g0089880 [Actinidia rufa]
MGNCFGTLKKSTAEIALSDFLKGSPVVRLYRPPADTLTCYIRFALLYKPVSVHFTPSQTLVLQFVSDAIPGTRETLIQYMDLKFPDLPLMRRCIWSDKTTSLVVAAAAVQHRSVTWHLERMVMWAVDLSSRGGRGRGGPAMRSLRMEVRKFGRSYSQLLEVMREHAQMEEKVVFPILEMAKIIAQISLTVLGLS